VQGAPPPEGDRARQREVVHAFLAASRSGDLGALLALLDPQVVLRADELSVQTAASYAGRGGPSLAPELRGAQAVAESFKGRAKAARAATLDGEPGAIWWGGGQVRAAFGFTIEDGRIVEIELMMSPARLASLHIDRGGERG
jgi:RNA polymerase sigma-70 factor (ECF subfamily)